MSTAQLRPKEPHLSIHAVSVYVRDQQKSLRFYVDQLGFDVVFDAQLQSGDRWVAVSPPDGGALLTLIAPKPESRLYKMIGRPTGVVFVTEDVISKYAEWSKRGVQFQYTPRLRRVRYGSQTSAPASAAAASAHEDHEQIWGGVFTHFKDRDGNSFLLAGFDEVTRQIEEQRRVAAERLRAEQRAAQELEIAKQVQARLFPQSLPCIASLECAGTCLQARQVGGDYFDFVELGDNRIALFVGDIAGKGMAAALLMANLQANLRIHCATSLDQPAHLLRSVNHVFYKNSIETAYATLFFAEYEDSRRLLRFANCGHLPALLLGEDGSVERLGATATVLGLFVDWQCQVEERALSPGDILAVYTDGVTESFNARGEDFGEERLIAALRRHRDLPPASIVPAIVEEVQQFGAPEQYDDITLIVAKCR